MNGLTPGSAAITIGCAIAVIVAAALLSLVRQRRPGVDRAPPPVGCRLHRPGERRARSGGRRLLAITIDVAAIIAGCVASIVFYRLVLTTGLDYPFDAANGAADTALGAGAAVVAQAIALIMTGSTVGEQIVDLRRQPRATATFPIPWIGRDRESVSF